MRLDSLYTRFDYSSAGAMCASVRLILISTVTILFLS